MNEMSLAESTPFAAHDIDCRAVDTTTFASPSSLVRDVWQCDLFPSGALFRSSAWDLAITDVAQSVSALTEQLQASMATMVTSLRPYELPRWLISGAATVRTCRCAAPTASAWSQPGRSRCHGGGFPAIPLELGTRQDAAGTVLASSHRCGWRRRSAGRCDGR